MAKLKIASRSNWFTVLCFQLCVITNNLFDKDEQLIIVAKLATILFFGVVALRILQRGKIRYHHILLLPITFTVYCAATIIWANVPDVALTQMVTQIQLLLLLICTYWAMDDGVTVLDYLKAVYVSGFCMAVYVVVIQGGPMAYLNAMLEGERIGGVRANTYGLVFSNAALCAAYYIILRGRKKDIISLILFAAFALSTASRKAMLMIVIGVVILAVVHYGWRRMYRTLLIVGVVALVGMLVLRIPYFNNVSERITRMLAGEKDASDQIRQGMIDFGLQLFKERPIWGFGIANFATMHFHGVYSHNNFIELLVSGGIIALVMYYLMQVIPVLSLLGNKKKGEKMDPMHLMLLVIITVEAACALAQVQLYRKNSWLLMGVLMAESVRASRKKLVRQEESNETA